MKFYVKAKDRSGWIHEFFIVAKDYKDAMKMIEAKGLAVIKVCKDVNELITECRGYREIDNS